MDHQNANLIEFTTDPIETKTIHSQFTHTAKEKSLHQGENKMHTKEQHQQAEYYRALGTIIHQYESVVLFGPTEAKSELFNILNSDHHFSKVRIHVEKADKMTENQQHAFVKNYFKVAG
ncbi:MAG: hypothetical protein WDO14_21910 [Bacteroidota bacterium]